MPRSLWRHLDDHPLEQLDTVEIAGACVDEDGRIGSANNTFLHLTDVEPHELIDRGLAEFLETTAIEHNAHTDGAVYRFRQPRGDRWLRPRRSRNGLVITLVDVSNEWSMLGKLVSAIDVRDRLSS